jgi:hypothetical protein
MNNATGYGSAMSPKYAGALVVTIRPNADFSRWTGDISLNGKVVMSAVGSAQGMLDMTEEAIAFLSGANGSDWQKWGGMRRE